MKRAIPLGAALGLILSAPVFALTIIPTFDSTITSAANAQDIENCVNSAVAIYSQLFTNNVTVQILFRYSDKTVQGNTFGLGRKLLHCLHGALRFVCREPGSRSDQPQRHNLPEEFAGKPHCDAHPVLIRQWPRTRIQHAWRDRFERRIHGYI